MTNRIIVPKDVWNTMIDKIEPEPFKLPEFIIITTQYSNLLLRTSLIERITGPYKPTTAPIYYTCHMKKARYDISQLSNEITFDLIVEMYKFYNSK